MLNPKWLDTFSTLVETGSFTKTAERLYMTQPGVSQHIKKLEQQLGETLIYREGKKFDLTRAGSMLVEYVAEQKRQQETFLEKLWGDNPFEGDIRLACSGSMAMKLYTPLLDLQVDHPALSVSIEAAPADRIRQLLLNNDTDLGISTQKFDHPLLEETLLGEEELCVIVPSNSNANGQDFEALSALGFVYHPDGKHYADLVLATNFVDDYRGVETLPYRGYVNQLAQILLPVSKGLGFTVLPRSVVERFEHPALLKVLELASPVSQALYLSRKKHRELPKRFETAIASFQQALSQ